MTHSTQRPHDAIITPLLRQNDVATSFWRNNNVVIASCARWGMCVFQRATQWLWMKLWNWTCLRTQMHDLWLKPTTLFVLWTLLDKCRLNCSWSTVHYIAPDHFHLLTLLTPHHSIISIPSYLSNLSDFSFWTAFTNIWLGEPSAMTAHSKHACCLELTGDRTLWHLWQMQLTSDSETAPTIVLIWTAKRYTSPITEPWGITPLTRESAQHITHTIWLWWLTHTHINKDLIHLTRPSSKP